MKFTTDIVSLSLALQKAKNTVSMRESKPILKNFCLKLEGEILSIMASDLDLSTVCKIKVNNTEDGATTIDGQKFLSIVDLSNNNETMEFVLEGHTAHIKVGKYESFIQTKSAEEFPTIKDFEAAKAQVINKQKLLTMLNTVSFSIADDEKRKNLMAVKIGDGYCQASDGKVSSLYKMDFNIETILIPANAVQELVRVLRASNSSEVSIAVSENNNFLMFKLDNDLFVCTASQLKFPDLVKLGLNPANTKNNYNCEVDKIKFSKAIQRCAATSGKFVVNLRIGKNTILVSTKDGDGNYSKEIVECTSNVEEGAYLEISLNFVTLLDVIKSITINSLCKFTFSTELRVPIKFTDENFTALLLKLIVIENSEQETKKYWEKDNSKKSYEEKKAEAEKRQEEYDNKITELKESDADFANSTERTHRVVAGIESAGRKKFEEEDFEKI